MTAHRRSARVAMAILWVTTMACLPCRPDATDAGLPALARFEPADGYVYHGAAPNPTVVAGYVDALDEAAIAPLIEGIHLGIAGRAGRAPITRTVRDWLEYVRDAGRVPHLSLSFTDGFGNPADEILATTTRLDAVIDELGAIIAAFGDPVFIRLGFEFNGSWNGYTAGVYPRAFRKVVERFRTAGVTNAATIWCYEPDGPDDFDAVLDGESACYPGDDVVDWFGLDLFGPDHFTAPTSTRARGNSAYERSLRFLEMASAQGKPVMLSENAAVKAYVTSDADDPGLVDGRSDWETWFGPFFAFIADHPQIKGFLYMNQDYRNTVYELEHGWGDCRIETNSYILDRYRDMLHDERFVHAIEGLSGS